ncbi:MAG: hypothetical protein WCF17_01245 [Terracidiphilus sp.]
MSPAVAEALFFFHELPDGRSGRPIKPLRPYSDRGISSHFAMERVAGHETARTSSVV